ncbi:aminotransferase class I/II-fold pyridoxal phosphate-dependent enzyme [Streptomyces sp. NPDC005820]|uniref:aminotransferase class I/II-fold pyridoxal phosphate-dependent enzyme n=1 Tax=Streptomyces sp. NPDC005820 TaxID=3157069 RepID=UPI0033FB6581
MRLRLSSAALAALAAVPSAGIVEILDVISSPADAVVINCPVYAPFYHFVEHTGRRIVEAPLGDDHRIDFTALEEAFERAAQHGPRPVHLLCSPHNPTGTVHTADELAAVAALAARHGVRVVSDEIHAPLVLPGAEFVPYLSVPGAESGMALMSASKAWNLAGLKAAVALAGPSAADDLARIPAWVQEGPSHLGVIAHTAALRDGTPWLDELLNGLAANRRLLTEHLPDIRYRPGEGTYLAWLDCRALDLGHDPATVFLEHGRVALNSGPTFGTGGTGHARLNLATSPELLTEAVRRMTAATAIATSS